MSESIYDWIKEEPAAPAKPARYKSSYDPTAPLTGSTIVAPKKPAGTIGRSVKDTIRPGEFQRTTDKSLPEPAPFSRTEATERKPAVPKATERPVMGVKSAKYFIVSNAVENILAVPKVRERGEPDYRHKADFGKVPAYLSEIKREIAEEKEFIATVLAEQSATHSGPRTRELPEEERLELLEALKSKWDVVNSEYQRIAFKNISSSNATAGEIRRKEECERQLTQLERDIERLSAKGPILVADD